VSLKGFISYDKDESRRNRRLSDSFKICWNHSTVDAFNASMIFPETIKSSLLEMIRRYQALIPLQLRLTRFFRLNPHKNQLFLLYFILLFLPGNLLNLGKSASGFTGTSQLHLMLMKM
jgi:hypothetical protein